MSDDPADRPIPWCETCNRKALPIATRWGERCTCPQCGRWSWSRKPLADRATHEARKAAHAAFDPLWRDRGPLTRGGAYKLLQEALGLDARDCHMATMDVETARLVPGAVLRIRQDLADGERVLHDQEQIDLFPRIREPRT